MPGTWPRPSSAISRSSHPSICPSIDPSSTPSSTSSRPSPPTRSTRSSPSSTCSPAISSKPQPENPLSGFLSPGGEADAQAGAPCGLLGFRVGGDAEDGVGEAGFQVGAGAVGGPGEQDDAVGDAEGV